MTTLNLLTAAIGVGLLLTLLLTEAFGLAAGGLVVPGYMALKLLQPWSFGLTLLIALATFVIVRSLGAFMIVYGRRRTALVILTGYLLGAVVDLAIGGGIVIEEGVVPGSTVPATLFFEVSVVGYIIPGLIALWFDRQGVVPTLSGLFVTSVLVRLVLIVFLSNELQAYEASQLESIPTWLRFSALGHPGR